MEFNNDPIAHSALLLTESNKLFDIIISILILVFFIIYIVKFMY